MKSRIVITLVIILCGALTLVGSVWAMSSGSYAIDWDVIGGGGEPASSANYAIRSTIGQPAVESSFSTNYGLWAGYWYPAGPAGPPSEPTIGFSPPSFSFSAIEGGANPADKTLEVWNSGAGTLDWSVSDDADWLSLSPPGGSSTGEHDAVSVSVNTSGRSAGHYDATITISAPGAGNTPQRVSVSLQINVPGSTVTWNLPWGLDADPASVNIYTYPGDAVAVTLADVEWSMPAGLLIWHYGGATEGWRFYKNGWGASNTLETLIADKGYIGIVPTASVWEIPQG